MATADATYDILIAIRDKLDGLDKAQRGMKNLGGGVDEVNAKSSKLGETFKAVFGANLAERALKGLAGGALEAATAAFGLASEIRDGAENLAMSARGFQVYRQLVRDSGGDWGSFTMAVTRMNRAIVESHDVSSAAAAAFEALNINPASVEAMDTEHRFSALATAIGKVADQETALAAQNAIFGERTIPRLRGAINSLATDGYDKLAKSMVEADSILEDSEIARLDAAAKKFEARKLELTRWAGDKEADILGVVFGEAQPLSAPPAQQSSTKLDDLAKLRAAVQELKNDFEDAAKAEEIFQNNPGKTDEAKRREKIEFLEKQKQLVKSIADLLHPDNEGSLPIDRFNSETRDKRLKSVGALWDQWRELDNAQRTAKGENPALQNLKNRALGVNDRARNPNAMTMGEGAQAGLLNWVISVGSAGEQAAGIIQDGLGGAITSISAKLAGNDVRSWGQIWRGVLQGMLQQFIQMQLQMAVIGAISGVFTPAGKVGVGSQTVLGSSFGPVGSMAPSTSLLPGRASGGDVEAGRMYQVNERGYPEVFIPRVSGRISPSALSLGGGQGGATGGDTFHLNYVFNGGVSRGEVMAMLPQLVQATKSAVVDGQRRRRDGLR